MKASDRWLLPGIIALPVVVGIVLLLSGRHGDGATSYSLGRFKTLGLVQIKGTITESEDYIRQLQSLRLDNSIAGVILLIDSPGGAVAPSQEIYEEVLHYRTEGKPLVVSMSTVAASGTT